MGEMANIKAQMTTSHLKEAITELARSQVENASLRVEMENYQAEIIQKSHLEEAMNELATSQAEFTNFHTQFMNETRVIFQTHSE